MRQPGEHPGTVQEHLVVTRGGLFPRVREGGRLRAGHQQDVAEVVAAGAGQVRVRKAVDDAVAVVVAAAAVPVACLGAGVRAQLHHPEGRDGAGKGVAVSVGAGKGIDVLGDGEQQGEQDAVHGGAGISGIRGPGRAGRAPRRPSRCRCSRRIPVCPGNRGRTRCAGRSRLRPGP